MRASAALGDPSAPIARAAGLAPEHVERSRQAAAAAFVRPHWPGTWGSHFPPIFKDEILSARPRFRASLSSVEIELVPVRAALLGFPTDDFQGFIPHKAHTLPRERSAKEREMVLLRRDVLQSASPQASSFVTHFRKSETQFTQEPLFAEMARHGRVAWTCAASEQEDSFFPAMFWSGVASLGACAWLTEHAKRVEKSHPFTCPEFEVALLCSLVHCDERQFQALGLWPPARSVSSPTARPAAASSVEKVAREVALLHLGQRRTCSIISHESLAQVFAWAKEPDVVLDAFQSLPPEWELRRLLRAVHTRFALSELEEAMRNMQKQTTVSPSRASAQLRAFQSPSAEERRSPFPEIYDTFMRDMVREDTLLRRLAVHALATDDLELVEHLVVDEAGPGLGVAVAVEASSFVGFRALGLLMAKRPDAAHWAVWSNFAHLISGDVEPESTERSRSRFQRFVHDSAEKAEEDCQAWRTLLALSAPPVAARFGATREDRGVARARVAAIVRSGGAPKAEEERSFRESLRRALAQPQAQ